MNVADFNASGKSGSSNCDSLKEIQQAIHDMADELTKTIHMAAENGESFDFVERRVRDTIFEMGKHATDLFIVLQGDGDLGEQVRTEEGQTLHRSEEPCKTNFRSIFGVHCFEQFTYAPGPKKAIALRPLSARMSLPKRRWSYLLQEFTQMLLVASADCKGVPLVKEDAAKVAAFEQSKKNPGSRRMATVASVYSVAPHVREAEDITAALFRDEPQAEEEATKTARPKPANKNTTAHFPEVEDNGVGGDVRISGIHVAMAWIIGQIALRRRAGQVLIVLMDGQESLWETIKLHLSFGAAHDSNLGYPPRAGLCVGGGRTVREGRREPKSIHARPSPAHPARRSEWRDSRISSLGDDKQIEGQGREGLGSNLRLPGKERRANAIWRISSSRLPHRLRCHRRRLPPLGKGPNGA